MRWIFLSHDDVEHSGNLEEVMHACPNGRLVCNWAMVERHTSCFDHVPQFPLAEPPALPDQSMLDEIVAATLVPPS